MKKIMIFAVLLIAALVLSAGQVSAAEKKQSSGKALFLKNCSGCHENGGNLVKPEKTLSKKRLAENNIKTTGDIIKKMRNPVPPMPVFDPGTISDKDAKKIAEYVLSTFK